MLHKEILTPETLSLLKTLMKDSNLQSFNLVGGTALSLYIGHRMSIDLDLFTPNSFDARRLSNHLTQEYGFKENFIEKDTLKGTINGVFVDLLTYPYQLLAPVNVEEDIRLLSIRDLASMKLATITDVGTRMKDFIDVAWLSTMYSLDDMIEDYTQKYPGTSGVTTCKALLYYDDMNKNELIQLINGKFSWKKVEERLQKMVSNPSHIFYNDNPV